MRAIAIPVLAAVSFGCYGGDPAVNVDVFNAGDAAIVVMELGPDLGLCSRIDAHEVENVYRSLGPYDSTAAPSFQFEAPGSDPVVASPAQESTVFVFRDGAVLDVPARFEQGKTRLLYDLPEVPEINRVPVPKESQPSADDCEAK